MVIRILVIALGGAAGALARWGTSELVNRVVGHPTPLATGAANLLGCFLFGVVWVLAEERLMMDAVVKAALLTGFMGAYTTFSTFVFDSGSLLSEGQPWLAALNIGGQVVLGVLALFAGFGVGRAL